MTAVRLLREAEEELRVAAEFYEAEQPGLGRALIQEVRRGIRFISARPFATSVQRSEIRARTISRFPYRIYYRAGQKEIVIVAIGHSRRRPGYWRART
jgi:toxin ParE1/3/4